MQQEELARLFSANMNLAQTPPPQPPQSQPQQEQQQQQQQQEQEQPVHQPEPLSKPITYASQHYTHTHYVVPAKQEPVKTHIDASELAAVLLRNSIDPTLLFPSQIDLFQNADDDQRLRLLELWRISPPSGRQGYPPGVDYNTSRQLYDWPPTSLAQEEAMAKLRYEKALEQEAQEQAIRSHQQQLEQSMYENEATRNITSSPSNAEPYIVSGYDMLARREYEQSAKLAESNKYNQATDPVYGHMGSNGGLWEKNVGSILDMENQYGAFAHARDYDVRPIYHDEEMVM